MDSLTDGFAKLNTNQVYLVSPEARKKYRDSRLKEYLQWIEFDSDEAFDTRPGIKSPDECGNTAVHWVLEGGSSDLLHNLLGRNAAVDIPNKDGFYAVHMAVEVGSIKQLQLLERAGASMWVPVGPDALLESIGQHGRRGATALHLAVADGHLEMVKLFLKWGVHPCVKMWDGSTAMHIAAEHLHPQGPNDYKGLVKGLEACLKALFTSAPESVGIRDNLDHTPFHRALATQAPCEIQQFFFRVCAPLGRQISNSCYVASVKLQYYHGRGQWQDDESKKYDLASCHDLIRELKDEVSEISNDGDILHVKVDYQLWRPGRARL